jgi:hypothetical protein
MKKYLTLAVMVGSLLVSIREAAGEELIDRKSAVELRSMQTRVFQVGDKHKVYRAILSVLQDLGYMVTAADPEAGTVSGSKLGWIDITIAVSPTKNGTSVRANALMTSSAMHGYPGENPQISFPQFYQRWFYEPLSKALFLEALYDEDARPRDEN